MTLRTRPLRHFYNRTGDFNPKSNKLFCLKPVESLPVRMNALQMYAFQPGLLDGRLPQAEGHNRKKQVHSAEIFCRRQSGISIGSEPLPILDYLSGPSLRYVSSGL